MLVTFLCDDRQYKLEGEMTSWECVDAFVRGVLKNPQSVWKIHLDIDPECDLAIDMIVEGIESEPIDAKALIQMLGLTPETFR